MYSVLVVDDEIRQREAVIKSVNWEKAGFKVVGDAENGIEALELLEKLEPDLTYSPVNPATIESPAPTEFLTVPLIGFAK